MFTWQAGLVSLTTSQDKLYIAYLISTECYFTTFHTHTHNNVTINNHHMLYQIKIYAR